MCQNHIQASLFILLVHSSPTLTASPIPDYQKNDVWFTQGRASVEQIQTHQYNKRQARNVILFIGDGMGIPSNTASRIYEGQQKELPFGEKNLLSFEKFPYLGFSKTYSTTRQTPDSASTMTAIATGIKTASGMLSINPALSRKDCALTEQGLYTLLHYSKQKYQSVGLISTARLTHATPAALYAHASERNWEYEVKDGCQTQVKDIAQQLVLGETVVDVALGGGARAFVPQSFDKNIYGVSGRRTDNLDLIAAWKTRFNTRSAFVQNATQLTQVNAQETDHLLGLFSNSHMSYEADRDKDDVQEPSLTQMSLKTLEILARNPQGFFMMAEAGRIDHAHHDTNAARALVDTIALSDAVAATVNFLKKQQLLEETLIIVTADHSHVVTFAGQAALNNPVLGLVKTPEGTLKQAMDDKPYTALGYTNGPSISDTLPELKETYNAPGLRSSTTDKGAQQKEFLQHVLVFSHSETHAGEDVTIYATGPGAHYFSGNMEQNVIFHIINHVAALNADEYKPS